MQYRSKRDWIPYVVLPLSILMVMLVIMMFTGQWPTRGNGYNSYTLQACAWTEGRLDLGQDYPWLELAIFQGKYFVSFPPFPSYVMLPFALVFGTNTPDGFIALFVTLLGIIYAIKLYQNNREDQHCAFWILFLYLGTGFLFISLNGYVWFIAQNMYFTLSLMALYHAQRGQGGTALCCWACAVGCRPMAIVYLPLLAYLLWKDWRGKNTSNSLWLLIRKKWYWALGPIVLGGSYMLLNLLRFDNILEFGHNYLPEFTRTETGQFSFSYLANNLQMLLRLPEWRANNEPLVFHFINGMAFWLINPMFIFVAIAWVHAIVNVKKHDLVILMLVIFLSLGYVFILCLHKTMGGWQFGNRYLVEIMPWLFFGLTLWLPKADGYVIASLPLLCFGAALNLAGTIAAYIHW